ncbi:MAG: thioredoxin family protein [Bacillota bacterium]
MRRISELGVTVFPTVVLDEEILCQGRIPDETELLEAIRARI